MSKCLFCDNNLPLNRKKYCSKECIKRAWYKRNNKANISIYNSKDDILKTSSGKAHYWEKLICNKVGAIHLRKRNIDIFWNGFNIDVKVAEKYRRKIHHNKSVKKENLFGCWVFNRNNYKSEIHYFLCLCLNNNVIEKSYLIPNREFPVSGMTIGNKSKFDKYFIEL